MRDCSSKHKVSIDVPGLVSRVIWRTIVALSCNLLCGSHVTDALLISVKNPAKKDQRISTELICLLSLRAFHSLVGMHG